MNTFRRIFSYARPAIKYWPPYLLLSILSVIFGIVNYALLAPVLTVLFESDEVPVGLPKPEFELSIGKGTGCLKREELLGSKLPSVSVLSVS